MQSRSGFVTLKLEGVNSRDDVEELRGVLITVPRQAVPPPPEGHFYHFQLIGMHVRTTQDEDLGCITEILTTGSNDVYVAKLGGMEVLIPALDEVIREVNVREARMTVDLPQGLR
jgi:16S rRNA processing protein RimM